MRTTGTVLGREPVFDRALISVGKASNQLNRSVRFTEFAMKRIRDDRGEAGAPSGAWTSTLGNAFPRRD